MSGAVLNSRFLRRLLTVGEEDIERVTMLKEDISSTVCELTMFILSIYVTCLTVTCSNEKGSSFLTHGVYTSVTEVVLLVSRRIRSECVMTFFALIFANLFSH